MRNLLLAAVLASLAAAVAAPAAAALAAPAPAAHAAGPSAAHTTEAVPVPAPNAKVLAYYRRDNAEFVANYLTAALSAIVVLFTGLSARMRTAALRLGRFWPLAIPIYLLLFEVVDFVISTPVAYYFYRRDRDFGLSHETPGAWLREQLFDLPGALLFVAVLMIVFYAFLRMSPRRWWLYAAIPLSLLDLASVAVSFAMQPQSKGFGPVKDAAQAVDARALAARAGLRDAALFQADRVKGTAAVGGWLGKPRIVLQDPATAKLPAQQQRFMLGRELGAYRLREQIKYSLMRGLLSIVGLYLLYRGGTALIRRFKDRFGFDQMSDFASWPIFPVLFNVFFLLVKPVDTGFARYLQHESDRFGLELVQDNRACGEAFVAVQSSELVNPRPGALYELFRGHDQPLAERVEFCNDYRPWEKGEPLKYGALFAGNLKAGSN
jgi:STE24 endopeptidase